LTKYESTTPLPDGKIITKDESVMILSGIEKLEIFNTLKAVHINESVAPVLDRNAVLQISQWWASHVLTVVGACSASLRGSSQLASSEKFQGHHC